MSTPNKSSNPSVSTTDVKPDKRAASGDAMSYASPVAVNSSVTGARWESPRLQRLGNVDETTLGGGGPGFSIGGVV